MSKKTTPFILGAMLLLSAVSLVVAEPMVAGVTSGKLEPEMKGLVLVEELNCAACHAGDASLTVRSKKAPRLADVGSRVNPAYMEAFIGNPHATKPGTTMPDLLGRLGDAERKETATALTHFLLSLKKNDLKKF